MEFGVQTIGGKPGSSRDSMVTMSGLWPSAPMIAVRSILERDLRRCMSQRMAVKIGRRSSLFSAFPWKRLWFSPAGSPFSAYPLGIALSPTDPDVILVGIEFGAVVRSADGGRFMEWSSQGRAAGLPHVSLYMLRMETGSMKPAGQVVGRPSVRMAASHGTSTKPASTGITAGPARPTLGIPASGMPPSLPSLH